MCVNADGANQETNLPTGDETMANENKTADLRTAMQQLDPTTYQEIRESYYRIADNLKPLADALEKADADQGGDAGPLLDEHFLFLQMYDLLRKSNLGGVV
ncbi:MAG: hypothetical protein ACF8CQ_25110 [Rhodopirellula sp. JB044]|uniref:hypothetical protein n=1 Tax=Rhodopirellula sp. JB044 TaxID=3342844 RepID=UPI00370B95B7